MGRQDSELVLGVRRERILNEEGWRGVRSGGAAAYLELIEIHGEYRRRDEAEDDPSWKQIIPYLLLRDRDRLYLMRRTRAGGDARLHERYSLGIGGHLNPEDGDLHSGLRREFTEELQADWQPEPELLGLLNDDSDPVGAVHLGVVYVAEAAGRPVAIRETDKLSGGFVTADEVIPVYDHLETWSQLLYDFVTGSGVGQDVQGAISAAGGIIRPKE